MKLKYKILLLSLISTVAACGGDHSSDPILDPDNIDSALTISVRHETLDNGESDKIYRYQYDAQGHKVSETYDQDDDGVYDRIIILEYDAAGEIERESRDIIGDGVINELITHTRQNNEHHIEYAYDNDGDGSFDRIVMTIYDLASYQFISRSIDENGDGIIDEVINAEDNSNAEIKIESEEFYNTVNYSTTYSYNADFEILSVSTDNDGDGTIDEITTYTYNAQGNRGSESIDFGADGTPEQTIIFGYDGEGNNLTQANTYASGAVTTTRFNEQGHITGVTYEEIEMADRLVTYSYSGDLTILDMIYIPNYIYWF